MLGGVSPILIITLNDIIPDPLANAIAGIPMIGETLAAVGIPLPIYLDENFTGIVVDTESKALDVETSAEVRYDGETPRMTQRGINSLVTINMEARKDSIVLGVLLALNDIIFTKLVNQKYSISYMNGSTVVFAGLLHGFSANSDSNTDKILITMQISKAKDGGLPSRPFEPLSKVRGAVPIAGAPIINGGLA